MSAQPKVPMQLPANDPPQMRTFKSLVAEFGFVSTRALREWCVRRGVPYQRDGGYNWADRNQVLAALHRGPTVKVDPKPAEPSVAGWVTHTLGGPHGT